MALNPPFDPDIMPQLTARRYLSAIDELGSPIPNSTPALLTDLPKPVVDREMVTLFGDALTLAPGPNWSAGGSCHKIDSTNGSILLLRAPASTPIMVTATGGGAAALSLGLMQVPSTDPVRQVQLASATPEWLHLPDTGRPLLW